MWQSLVIGTTSEKGQGDEQTERQTNRKAGMVSA